MYCMKCGKAIDDSAVVCPYCNAAVDIEKVNEARQAQRQKDEAVYKSASYTQGPAYDKPSKAPVIAVACVVALLLIGGGITAYILNRPIAKVNKAIEKNDIDSVNEYYDKLSDQDKEDVTGQMLELSEQLRDDYVDKKKTYDTVEDSFDELSRGVLKDNDVFAGIVSEVERLNESRNAYDAAGEAFEKKDYAKASELYAKVIKEDANYSDAMEKKAQCDALVTPDVVGEWACTVDIGNAMLKTVGMNGSEVEFEFPLTMVLEFKEDGTGSLKADEAGVDEKMKEFVEIALDEIIRQYELNYGMSEADLDKLFKTTYGKSFRAYINEMLEEEDLSQVLAEASEDFTYEVGSETVTITSNEKDIDLDIKDGNLELKDLDYETFVAYSTLGVELPLVFEKR